MKRQVLLTADVDPHGRKGDLITVKAGYARNFLLPQQRAVYASKQTLQLRLRLQKERAEEAKVARAAAEQLAGQLEQRCFTITARADAAGHLYGSVTASDIITVLQAEGITVEKKTIIMPHIKQLGDYTVDFRLPEGVQAHGKVTVSAEVETAAGGNG